MDGYPTLSESFQIQSRPIKDTKAEYLWPSVGAEVRILYFNIEISERGSYWSQVPLSGDEREDCGILAARERCKCIWNRSVWGFDKTH